MKQVFKTYGAAIVAMIVMGGLFLIWGIFFYEYSPTKGNVIAVLANESLEGNNPSLDDGTAFLEYQNRRLPEIGFCDDIELQTGEYIPVDTCFWSISHNGESLPIKVTDIKNVQEESMSTHFYEGMECFYFEVPGIYHVFVEAEDMEKRKSYAMVKIPVNRGGME